MPIKVVVLRERAPGEKRVALVPALMSKLEKLGVEVTLEAQAGEAATFKDTYYAKATIATDVMSVLGQADIVLAVHAPSEEMIAVMRPGAILISQLFGANHLPKVKALQSGDITTFAMEHIPRISRAQAMDVLSSQAALTGYYAPLLGAIHMPRILPMMTTAVGSLRAAKVLVMGLGVAGLSALATARRLGAITEGYDVRPETREQAQSLGAKFVETGIDARGEGGYARELSAEEKEKVAAIISQHIAEADMVITTAALPGRPAPKLISAAQIAAMKPGAVIVDLAAEGGGNCEGTRPGENVTIGNVTLLGPLNVPSSLAQHASELYAKNVLHFLDLIVREGKILLNFDDEVVTGTAVIHEGDIRNEALKRLIDPSATHA